MVPKMSVVGPSRVFVDANVLYSRTLLDWVGLLASDVDAPPFRVYWSEDVLAEATYHLRKKHPDWDGRAVARARSLLEATFEGGRVEDYRPVVSLSPRDPGDAHVAAAAAACEAHYLLTQNAKHFDDDATCYDVVTADEFFVLLDDASPDNVREAVARQMRYWCGKREEALLPEHLEKAGCPLFAERVRRHQWAIGGIRI